MGWIFGIFWNNPTFCNEHVQSLVLVFTYFQTKPTSFYFFYIAYINFEGSDKLQESP